MWPFRVSTSGCGFAPGDGVHVPQLANPQQKKSPKASTDAKGRQAERTYVLDTSVLLSDPKAIFRFAEHAVVLPVVVIAELEGKRNDPEIGYFARQALRNLDEVRVQHERLDFPIAIGDAGGSLRVELNHSNMSVLPSGLQLGDNDSRILAVALNLAGDDLMSRSFRRISRCGSRQHPSASPRRNTAPNSRSTPAGPARPTSPCRASR